MKFCPVEGSVAWYKNRYQLRSVQIWGIYFSRLAVRSTQMTSRFVRPLHVCVKHRSVFYTEYVFQVAPTETQCG